MALGGPCPSLGLNVLTFVPVRREQEPGIPTALRHLQPLYSGRGKEGWDSWLLGRVYVLTTSPQHPVFPGPLHPKEGHLTSLIWSHGVCCDSLAPRPANSSPGLGCIFIH